MILTIDRDIKLDVSSMDGSFAVATYSESGKDDVKVKAEFCVKSDLDMDFEYFLTYHSHENLIIRINSFECKPEDYARLTDIIGSTESDRKNYVIAYKDYESTIDQLFERKKNLLKDESKTFWEYKIIDGIRTAFIAPTFQQFWNEYVHCLLHLHENGYKHRAIEDLKRCVLLSEDTLQSFKMIPSVKADIKKDDLSGLSDMMSKLSPDRTCLYEEKAREFLTYSERSVIDTLKTLKQHPLLVPPSCLKKMVSDVWHIWGQSLNSRESAERKFIGPFIAKMNKTEHYQLWPDQIEEWIDRKKRRAEKDFISASTEQIEEECNKQQQIENMGACMRHKITEYHKFSFTELVRYMNNKFKHAWERHGNNVPATFTEAEFIETLIEIFPEIHVILFEYIYRSKRCFSGPYNAGEIYPCDNYSVLKEIDVRYKK